MPVLGLDISSYQKRPPKSWFESLPAGGFKLAVVQAWGGTPNGRGPNPDCEYQLRNFRLAKLDTAIYIWLPPDDGIGTKSLVDTAIQAAGGELDHVRFVSIDIEGGLLHPTDPAGRLKNAIEQSRGYGKPLNIYTSISQWARVMRSVTDSMFHSLPLWEARYVLGSGKAPEKPPDFGWRWQPFGGWQERAGLQYAGTAPVNGVGADLNLFDYQRLGIEEGITRDARVERKPRPGREATRRPRPTPKSPEPGWHVVGAEGARGLYGVWEALGQPSNWQTFWDATNELNGWAQGSSPTLQRGQRIKVPSAGRKPAQGRPRRAGSHTVGEEGARGLYGVWEALGQPGDWKTFWDATCKLNGWAQGSSPVLRVGQRIKIPA